MMMKSCVSFLSLIASAAAFSPSTSNQAPSTTSLNAVNLKELPGATAPLQAFDPLGLAGLGDETFNWFQAAELKHGRCAMVATTGFLIQAAGLHFPGMLSSDVSFESLSKLHPAEQWDAVPGVGKAQIFATILLAEIATEANQPHYMKGGPMPEMVIPKVDFSNVDPAVLKTKRARELNNGRLAQIAIMSFIAEYNIPGSVPVLSGIAAFHA